MWNRFFKEHGVFYIILIGILPFLFFFPALNGKNIITAGDFSGSDLLDMQLPLRHALHNSVNQGELPLWSSNIGNGFPIFAEGQGGFLYPLNLLFLSFTPEKALNYSIIFTFSVAGWGAYFFSRRLPGLSSFAAFCIAISFMFSSFFVARVKHLNLITVSAWLPWLLLIGHVAITQQKYRLLLLAGVLWTVQMFGGHVQMLYFSIIIFLWWSLGEFVLLKIGEKNFRRFVRDKVLPFCLWLLLSVGFLVGLSAVQWVPTQELIGYSYRSVNSLNSFYSATAFPLHPIFFSTFYFPYILGNPADASYKYNIQTTGVWWENVMYIGLLPAIVLTGSLVYFFAVYIRRYRFSINFTEIAMHLKYSSQRRRYVYFISVSVLFFLALALGKISILYFAAYEIVPGMKLFRFPNRFNLFVVFGLCLLFGYFIDYWLRRLRILWYLKRVFMIIIVVFVLFDLSFFGRSYISFIPVELYNSYFSKSSIIEELQDKQGASRYYPAAQYSSNPYLFKGWKENAFSAIGSFRNVYAGHNPIIFGMDSFTDRDWAEGGLDIYRLSQIEERLLGENLDSMRINSRQAAYVLGLFNVKYVLSFNALDLPNYTLKEEHVLDPYFKDSLKIYLNNKVASRVYLTKELRYASDEIVLNKLFSEEHVYFDFAYTDDLQGVGGAEVVDNKDTGSVDITSNRNHSVLMKSVSQNDSYLVFADLYYPGWRAFVDGREVRVFRANFAQRAIKVPKGEHTIEWRYEPLSFKYGMYISLGSAIAFLLLLIIPFTIKRYAK